MIKRLTGVMTIIAALLTGCTPGAPRGCTAMGAAPGVGLEVAAPLAGDVDHGTMRVCWDGSCRSRQLSLAPSTSSAPRTCRTAGPDGSCGARMVPTGGKHGFVTVAGLPKRTVSVTVVLLSDAGTKLLDQQVRVTPEAVYPNGPDCGEDGPQARLEVVDHAVRVRR